MKASLTNHRQAPRKMRLVANSLKGKRVSDALAALSFMPKKAAEPLKKLVESALANAKVQDASADADDLIIRTITVDKAMVMTRYMQRAFGRASPIKKASSHVFIALSPAFAKKGKKAAANNDAPKAAPKPAAKKRATKKAA